MINSIVIFVPSYCLTRDGSRLTIMSQTSAERALELYLAGGVDRIILSTAYDTWPKEASLKKQILLDAEVPLEAIEIVPAVIDSFDEAEKVRQIVGKLNISKLIIVADRWQGPRAAMIFRYKFPDLNITLKLFQTPKYEFALEPHRIKWFGLIKGWRIGHGFTWAVWNLVMQFLTPILLYINRSCSNTQIPRKPSR